MQVFFFGWDGFEGVADEIYDGRDWIVEEWGVIVSGQDRIVFGRDGIVFGWDGIVLEWDEIVLN